MTDSPQIFAAMAPQLADAYPRFAACMPLMLQQEAPYPSQWGNPRNFSNDPGDPGGKTMDGIIQVEYDSYRVRKGLPRQDVRLISEVEGDDIYLHEYWLPYCPELPPGLDLDFFDAYVNEGKTQAVRILQYALGRVSDGNWGPTTDAAVKAIADVGAAVRAFTARRKVVYENTRNFTRFGADWERRTSEIGAAALKMASADVLAKPLPVPPTAPKPAPAPLPTSPQGPLAQIFAAMAKAFGQKS
jgi:lysozyme family protein